MEILKLKRMILDHSRYLTLGEVNRLVGFEDDIREAFDHFKGQHQTLLCSATMPTQILNFTKGALLKHVIVNTGKLEQQTLVCVSKLYLCRKSLRMSTFLSVYKRLHCLF
ncbi:unnamed protein product [Prunus brigantina]